MKTEYPELLKFSANLLNVLNTTFGRNLSEEINNIFKYCLDNGGFDELDFIRPDGQSYNPRPARIALILLSDCKKHDQDLLISAMLATIGHKQNSLSAEAYEICTEADNTKRYSRESKLIALAMHLDRARHFHLNPKYLEQKKDFHLLTKKILDITGSECQRVHELILHWLKRDEQKN